MQDQDIVDAIVVGGGPAGLTAAVALASGGVTTSLVGKRPARPDNRTTALLGGSVTALERSASGNCARRSPRRSRPCALWMTPAGCGARPR